MAKNTNTSSIPNNFNIAKLQKAVEALDTGNLQQQIDALNLTVADQANLIADLEARVSALETP